AFTADDVAATLGFARERIVVAHPGIGEAFRADGEREDLGRPYLLTVATLEPRKNLGTLVEAHALLADAGLALAVVGGAGWDEQRAKGFAHAATFSWARTGERFLEGYRRFS